MSLDYNLSEIENWQELCVRPESEKEEWHITPLKPKTHALVWASMLIEMGTITEKNVDEWDFRLRCIYRLDLGPTSPKNKPTREDIEKHIGLRMNVRTLPRNQFMTRCKKMLEQAVKDEIWRDNRKAASAFDGGMKVPA